MGDITGVVERLLNEKLKNKFGLVELEVKELKDEARELRHKCKLLDARVRQLEAEKDRGTDFGV